MNRVNKQSLLNLDQRSTFQNGTTDTGLINHWQVVYLSPGNLTPDKRNARTHSKAQQSTA